MTVQAQVQEIREALELVMDAIEREHGPVMDLDQDYYWALPIKAAFDMNDPSPQLTAGQLTDDLSEIRTLLSTNATKVNAWHDLAHVLGLLRWLELKTRQ
jgi:hypothetical protein